MTLSDKGRPTGINPLVVDVGDPAGDDHQVHWTVTHDAARWDGEMLWMTLYFSLAVWSSLALGGFVLVRGRLAQFRARPAMRRLAAHAVRADGAGTSTKIGPQPRS